MIQSIKNKLRNPLKNKRPIACGDPSPYGTLWASMHLVFKPKSPNPLPIIEMRGPDACDYLHRMTTVHLKDLNAGQVARGFFLNPQGRVRADFYLSCVNHEHYLFEVDPGPEPSWSNPHWKNELLAVVEQFHFAEKFECSALDAACAWVFEEPGTPDQPSGAHALKIQSTATDRGTLFTINHGSRDYGVAWMTLIQTGPDADAQLERWLKEKTSNSKSISFEELETRRIRALRPRLGSEITDQTIPLEVGLREGIAENKGCYPGQEVIEKIISLGEPAKRLALVEGEAGQPPPQSGATLALEEKPSDAIATLTSVTPAGHRPWLALALFRKTHAKVGQKIVVTSSPSARARIIQVSLHE